MSGMKPPSFQEDHISQPPALHFLQNLGYTYLSPEEALALRGGKTTAVLLEPVLRGQLHKINHIHYKGKRYKFTESNIQSGIEALKDVTLQEGLVAANEAVYNLLTLGRALEQTIDGDKKSYTLQYIDWKNWKNNAFHVTEEYSVQRAGSHEHYRPDIVLFVNGIPLVIIECKRPDIKEPISQAISQHLRNQREDGIRLLYAYSQVLMSISVNDAAYATTATREKFWSKWKEQFESPREETRFVKATTELKNQPLQDGQKRKIFSQRFAYVRRQFDKTAECERIVTEQDHYLYALCRPERLLNLAFNFIIYDAGT